MKKIRQLARDFGIGRAIALALLFDFVLLRVWDPAPVEALRQRAFDFYQLTQPRVAPAKPVVIVDIDDASLKALGQWPWPRTVVADLVTKVMQSGGVAVGFDVLFPEPDRVSPAVAAESFRGLDEETRIKLRALPSNDAVFAETIRRSRVILGQSGYRDTTADPNAGASIQTGFATLGGDPKPWLVGFPHLLRNIPALEEAAKGRGLFSIKPEADGVVRRIPLVMLADGVMVPSLSLELLRVVAGGDSVLVKSDQAGVKSVGVRGFEIPTDRRGQLWLHYSQHDPDKFISAKDVLEGRVPPQRIAGKLVLIGTSAVGLLDLKTTPVHAAMPGVEVHAQVLESVLTKATLNRPSYADLAELSLAAVLGLALIALAPRLGAGVLFVIGGLVAASILGLSWYAFAYPRILLDTTFPLLSSFSVYLTLVFTNYLRASADRKRIRSAFSQYLSPALVEELAQSPEKLTLGGEQREMTVLFSDVRGFTTISEQYKHDPQGLTTLMNRFLTPLTNVIIERKGTIDKYMGDAIMAFWNAPLPDADHELNACDAALTMIHSLAALNAEREREAAAAGQPFTPLKVGVGLNTGLCVVGNMGSDLHFNYSVLGDAVNLASRLEGQSKYYGVAILIGSRTAAAVEGKCAVLELDLLQVKGKTEPETIYTVVGREDVAWSEAFQRLRSLNQSMLTAYRSREWSKALEVLILCRDAGKSFGLDDFYSLYITRVRSLWEAPLPEDWDGVYVAESK